MIKLYSFRSYFIVVLFLLITIPSTSQHSVARQWNEALLDAIRNDFARPTVHARNLFHASVAMYDGWAVYDDIAEPFFLGKSLGDYTCNFNGIDNPSNKEAARAETISYAVYRLLIHRFERSPGSDVSLPIFNNLMDELGYDTSKVSTDYSTGLASSLGNYIAEQLIFFGLQDGSREASNYSNAFYLPRNTPMVPTEPGSQNISDPNRWQPLGFDFFIDQAGFEVPGGTPVFLGPEWGQVVSFSLSSDDLDIHQRDGGEYWVYHDPGPPAYVQEDGLGTSSEYQWGHSLVAIWSSQLDPNDGVMIDISPATIGNIQDYPTTIAGLRDFYNLTGGGDPSLGHNINPNTQQPYQEQIVPRADYARVLAEFWADGPDSETPPGHWFTILNYVNDHPLFEKKYEGIVLGELEWDVKAYFVLGGAMHDSAITAWGIKGWYDYIRPISAIRFMADQGQSSNPELPNYAKDGIPLKEGYVELVLAGDPLVGNDNENLNKIKVYAWRGPEYIFDPETDVSGVGWILAENWWPYQRPSFVTPPFAGYVSGHSTFSRAAAEVMTMLTGDEFFPGGMGEFVAKKNEFLVFEEGPSMDVTLQWATYRDASDQTSLSRIWGGIHPPVDDIPGRLIGEKIGVAAYNLAKGYFKGGILAVDEYEDVAIKIYPNPLTNQNLKIVMDQKYAYNDISISLYDVQGRMLLRKKFLQSDSELDMGELNLSSGIYIVKMESNDIDKALKLVVLE